MVELAIHDPEAIETDAFKDRFWAKARPSECGCWLWTDAVKGHGYPAIKVSRRWLMAHRVAYALTFGNFEKSKVVMHRCDNPRCINPDHLQLGSLADNSRDMFAKGRGSRSGGGSPRLSERQVQELRALHAAGVSVHEIGRRLALSRASVRWRLQQQSVRFNEVAR